METSGEGSDAHNNSPDTGVGESSPRSYGLQFSASNLLQAPISAFLEYSGILRPRSGYSNNETGSQGLRDRINGTATSPRGGEVSIRIIGSSEQDNLRAGAAPPQQLVVGPGRENVQNEDIRNEAAEASEGDPLTADQSSVPSGSSPAPDDETGNGGGGNSRDSGYQRYDIQQAARWIEQILPFSLLLLVVFIRQHLQGFFVTIWIAAALFKPPCTSWAAPEEPGSPGSPPAGDGKREKG